jgi:hypothetical protein
MLLGNQIKKDMMGRACGAHEGDFNARMPLAEKSEGGISFGRPRRRWKNNTEVFVKEK